MAANKNKKPNVNETIVKRERNKINSLARALQIEHSLYNRDIAMRLADLSDEIKQNESAINGLKMDIAEVMRQEFLFLFGKVMPLLPKQYHQQQNDSSAAIDFGQTT